MGFPFVHDGIAGSDPRTRYEEALRPWFVVFDGGATTFAGLTPEQRAFYVDNHYLTVATGVHEVAPALDASNPTPAAGDGPAAPAGLPGASVASSDWYQVPDWHRTSPAAADGQQALRSANRHTLSQQLSAALARDPDRQRAPLMPGGTDFR